MTQKHTYPEAQNPLILRASRLIEAFAKSNDERDFFLDKVEGFIIYADLDKPQESIEALENEIKEHKDRYLPILKMSFYETKKIMEGFVNEKVYDIDTKEKLLDIIDSKDARENFLEFIYDQHTELEKWQQFYQERSRIRIIEWLRGKDIAFVFEEDLELPIDVIEKLKEQMFEPKVGKELQAIRKTLALKAKTYYSSEALNPRPKRGRPPKLQAKQETEQENSADIYTTVPLTLRQFLFIPDTAGVSASTFSEKYKNEEELIKSRNLDIFSDNDHEIGDINRKLASLRNLSSKWISPEETKPPISEKKNNKQANTEIKVKIPITSSGKAEKKPEKVAKQKQVESEKTKSSRRSIIKKEASETPSKAPAQKKTPTKKRIIPQEIESEKNKRHLRKIIQEQNP